MSGLHALLDPVRVPLGPNTATAQDQIAQGTLPPLHWTPCWPGQARMAGPPIYCFSPRQGPQKGALGLSVSSWCFLFSLVAGSLCPPRDRVSPSGVHPNKP